jgi:hypothetical protein
MLPILSKDEQKQKEIEARAAQAVLASSKNKAAQPKSVTPAQTPKKPVMKIQAIPPFGVKVAKPEPVKVPETAKKDIDLRKPSPDPAKPATDAKSPVGAPKKLNPAASSFSFKPSAPEFKPGQSSTATATGTPAAAAGPSAGPSTATAAVPYSNPFFHMPPRPVTVNVRDDFVTWRHGPMPAPSSVGESASLSI